MVCFFVLSAEGFKKFEMDLFALLYTLLFGEIEVSWSSVSIIGNCCEEEINGKSNDRK